MKCLNCNAVLTVHIAGSDGMAWYRRHYCENCRRPRLSGYELQCESCSVRFEDFLQSGLLGCSDCYDAFAPEMEPLLEKYRDRTPGKHTRQYAPARLARARTLEAVRALAPDSNPNARAVPEPDPAAERAVPPDFGAGHAELDFGTFEAGVFTSFRLRAARNLRGIRYPARLGAAGLAELSKHLLGNRAGPALVLGHSRMQGEQGGDPHAPVRTRSFPNRKLELYTGDEDHLRFQWTLPLDADSNLGRELRRMLRDLAQLDELYEWQFHPVHGFLTACPASSGSGLRASFLVSVPGLKHAGLWAAWRHELRAAGFEIRGSRGEGSPEDQRAQISNRSWPADVNVPQALAEMLLILRRLEAAELAERPVSERDNSSSPSKN